MITGGAVARGSSGGWWFVVDGLRLGCGGWFGVGGLRPTRGARVEFGVAGFEVGLGWVGCEPAGVGRGRVGFRSG